MNWYIISLLSIPAILMAALSLRGYTQNIELYLWFLLGLFCILVVIKNQHSHLFLHLVLIGVLWGVFNSVIQSFFYDMYIAHNARAAVSFSRLESLQPRFVILLIGLATGSGTGVVMGFLGVFLRKLLQYL